MPVKVERVEVHGVVWYDVHFALGERSTFVQRMSEQEIKSLRDDLNDALRDVE